MQDTRTVTTHIFTPTQPYGDVLAMQEQAVENIYRQNAGEQLFIGQHAPVYTAGTSAVDVDYLGGNDIPVVKTGRGGKFTYHGPGQIVAYPILDLRPRQRDLRAYICDLQKWLIASLKEFGIEAYTRDEVGVWVDKPEGPAKIAAIGVRVRRWITFHGIALNVEPDLSHYQAIVPCGLAGLGITSLRDLGVTADVQQVEAILRKNFEHQFGVSLSNA